jgi:hypothetical protein
LAHALCPIPSTILAEFGHQNAENGETMEEANVSAMANQLALWKLPGIMGKMGNWKMKEFKPNEYRKNAK